MTAKLTFIGQPQGLLILDGVATFRIIAGPASSTAPKGLPLFKATTYVVRCSQRQLNRGRASDGDKSELVVEGYQEPRLDENGNPYTLALAAGKCRRRRDGGRQQEPASRSQVGEPRQGLAQLREDVGKAEDAYNAACDHANGVARTRRRPVPRPRRSRG